MTDTVFCYYCRRYHPADEVRLVQTNGGKRWRCSKSMVYGQISQEQRDAFGKSVSALNRSICSRASQRPLPHPVLELFAGIPSDVEGLA